MSNVSKILSDREWWVGCGEVDQGGRTVTWLILTHDGTTVAELSRRAVAERIASDHNRLAKENER
tara:strand:+ start:3186 stop:3380 length:195 start_codon:yes stop_codon:yes gene_type:complete